jgi:P27 family predicted phage terminase small subunit
MFTGPKPEPIERKLLKAKGSGRTPGNREIAIRQTYVTGRQRTDKPPTPRGLAAVGRREWHKIWDAGSWLKAAQDYHWVEQIARAYDEIETYRARVESDGLVQTGSMGQPVAHPLIAEIRRCEATIRTCLSILGFSPTDRARLGLAEIKARSALEEMIAKAGQNAPSS